MSDQSSPTVESSIGSRTLRENFTNIADIPAPWSVGPLVRDYGYGKKGWMSERFCHSEGLLTQWYENGTLANTWFCLMPWASGSVIEGLAGEYWG